MKRLSEAREAVDRMVPGDAVDDGSNGPKLGGFIEWLQQPGVRAHLSRVFSRKMLGSVLIAATTTRIIETSFAVAFGTMSPIRVLGWIVTWFAAIIVFISWDYFLAVSADKAEKAADKAEKVADKAEQTTKKSPRAAAKPAKKAEQTTDKVEKMLDDAEKQAMKKAKEKARNSTSQGNGKSAQSADSNSGSVDGKSDTDGGKSGADNEKSGSGKPDESGTSR